MIQEVAQQIARRVQQRLWSTVQTVVHVADTLGVGQRISSIIRSYTDDEDASSSERFSSHGCGCAHGGCHSAREMPTDDSATMQHNIDSEHASHTAKARSTTKPSNGKSNGRRQAPSGVTDKSKHVRQLKSDDSLDGSTYLARIIWCLGVADLEGTAPLKPADIARMVMARSQVTLEPPNIARYIRRNQPSTITVAHSEGGSNFYSLSPAGKKLFDSAFVA